MQNDAIKRLRNLDIPRKQAWLGIFFIAISVFFWSLLTYSMALRVSDAGILSFLIFLGLVWAVTYGLLVLFVDKRINYFLYGFLGILLLLFYGFVDFNFVGVIIFTLTLFLAYWRAKRFRGFIADFRPYHIARRFLPLFFTALAILLAFAYNSYVLKYYSQNPRIPKDIYSVMFMPVDYSLGFMLPNYEAGMSFGEFQNALLESFISNFLPPEYAGEVDTTYIPEFFGEDISNATLEEFSLVWLNDTIGTILEPYRAVLPALFVVGLFFVFRFILLPFIWISTGLLLLVIRIFLSYNILTIKEIETVKKVPILE